MLLLWIMFRKSLNLAKTHNRFCFYCLFPEKRAGKQYRKAKSGPDSKDFTPEQGMSEGGKQWKKIRTTEKQQAYGSGKSAGSWELP
ncbi:hypothetical protein HMPREF1548_06559 [Clostridium sp. KLE 1755]|nr:hypothetical protein HMPREF1548_06559 [Clostridium sp. KLE 1755]